MDKIVIDDIKIFAFHGVFDNEKKQGQDFLMDITLGCDLKKAGYTDDLNDTIDYGSVANLAILTFTEQSYDLIETAALNVCDMILNEFPKVMEAEVKISKPSAPVPKEVGNVAVCVSRKRRKAYIGLGSNLGQKEENIKKAISMLGDIRGTKVMKVSSFIETAPWGNTNQDDFINCAVALESFLDPEELLLSLLEIENKMGRVREEKWGPRIIDLDILMMEDLVINKEELIIPHPYLTKRAFALEPLKEIAAFAVHPLYNKRLMDIEVEDELNIDINNVIIKINAEE